MRAARQRNRPPLRRSGPLSFRFRLGDLDLSRNFLQCTRFVWGGCKGVTHLEDFVQSCGDLSPGPAGFMGPVKGTSTSSVAKRAVVSPQIVEIGALRVFTVAACGSVYPRDR